MCGGDQRLRPIWTLEQPYEGQSKEDATQELFCRKCVPHLPTCQTCGDKVGVCDDEGWDFPACHNPEKICQSVYWETLEEEHFSGSKEYAEWHHEWIDTPELKADIEDFYAANGYYEHEESDDCEADDEDGEDGEDADSAAEDSDDSSDELICAHEQCGCSLTDVYVQRDWGNYCQPCSNAGYDIEEMPPKEFNCSWASCGKPIAACEAATWMGDGKIYCLDCMNY